MAQIKISGLHVKEIILKSIITKAQLRAAEKELNFIQDNIIELESDFCNCILNTPFSYNICFESFKKKFDSLFANIKNSNFIYFGIDTNYFDNKYHFKANVFK